jgi:hypothetical protein
LKRDNILTCTVRLDPEKGCDDIQMASMYGCAEDIPIFIALKRLL